MSDQSTTRILKRPRPIDRGTRPVILTESELTHARADVGSICNLTATINGKQYKVRAVPYQSGGTLFSGPYEIRLTDPITGERHYVKTHPLHTACTCGQFRQIDCCEHVLALRALRLCYGYEPTIAEDRSMDFPEVATKAERIAEAQRIMQDHAEQGGTDR